MLLHVATRALPRLCALLVVPIWKQYARKMEQSISE